ncbi:MAG: hypothetical protein NC912_06785, partial [Candidatus Omnitrophica bacterium]|nr:hypothetical protein [Candidatus Omnitrophota bacterium]
LNECIFKKKICPQIRICTLKQRIDKIQNYVVSRLEKITLASLLKDNRRKGVGNGKKKGKEKDNKN